MGRPPLVRFHVERVHVESIGDEFLQLPCTSRIMLNIGEGEAANAEAMGSPARVPLRVHRVRALGWAAHEAQSNRGVRGTTEGSWKPASPGAKLSRPRCAEHNLGSRVRAGASQFRLENGW